MNTNHLVQNQSLEGMMVIRRVETGPPTRWEVAQLTNTEEEAEDRPRALGGVGLKRCCPIRGPVYWLVESVVTRLGEALRVPHSQHRGFELV